MLLELTEPIDIYHEWIDEAEKVYEAEGVINTGDFFMLLRAQAWRNLGDIQKSIQYLNNIHKDL